MAEKFKKGLATIKDKAAETLDKAEVKEKAKKAGEAIGDKAADIKNAAMGKKDDIQQKITELDRMLESSVTEYNDKFTLMNDKGVQLFVERSRSVDVINHIENLINSIANHPKSFDVDFEEINTNRDKFIEAKEFGDRQLKAARDAAGSAGAGLAAGASVAFMAPTAAMWVATTFGTASTGTAISTLSGAAASQAALAWLGGGAVSAGGGGVAAGHALLAMAGPIGWTIAGATLLSSIILFAKKRAKLNKTKNEEIEAVKQNIEKVKEMDAQINEILSETISVRDNLDNSYAKSLALFGKNYNEFSNDEKMNLGSLVNQTKALSALFGKTIS